MVYQNTSQDSQNYAHNLSLAVLLWLILPYSPGSIHWKQIPECSSSMMDTEKPWSGVGVTKAPFVSCSVSTIFDLEEVALSSFNHIHICPVSPQLSCGNTCQIWTWCSIGNVCFGDIENKFKKWNAKNGWVTPTPGPWTLMWLSWQWQHSTACICLNFGYHLVLKWRWIYMMQSVSWIQTQSVCCHCVMHFQDATRPVSIRLWQKKTAWEVWHRFLQLTTVKAITTDTCILSKGSYDMAAQDTFVVILCCRPCSADYVKQAHQELFNKRTRSPDSIPPKESSFPVCQKVRVARCLYVEAGTPVHMFPQLCQRFDV